MKKVLFLSFIAILSIGVAVAYNSTDDDRPVAAAELPKKVQDFVKQHFAGSEISYA